MIYKGEQVKKNPNPDCQVLPTANRPDQTLSCSQNHRNTVNVFLSMSAGVLFCSSNSQYKEVIKLKEALVIQSAEQQDQISITC